jgi:putative phosphoesterase
MQIGILSDTHSNHRTVETALALLRRRGVQLLLHCGDIEDAEAVHWFQGFETHFVWGNCDGDRKGIRRAIEETGATLHEPFGNLELEGQKLAWIHSDDKRLFLDVERSNAFDYLFYGHTHQAEQHRTGATLVVNPGALHRARVKTFVILDLTNGTLESVTVE